jgi:hypothetical protein
MQLTDSISVYATGNFTIAAASTPQFITTLVPAQSAWGGSNINGLGGALNIYFATTGFNIAAANGNTLEITGLIILPGNEAPSAARAPFIMRPYDQELAICQRYFETYVAPYSQVFISALQNSAATYYTSAWTFRTRKRAAPTFALTGGASWNTAPSPSPGTDGVIFTFSGASYVLQTTLGALSATADARL